MHSAIKALLLVFLLAIALFASLPPLGRHVALADSSARDDAALFLARVCVNEAGWSCFETGDGLAIHEVFLRGAARQGTSYLGFARAYCARISGRRATSSARIAWTRELRADGAAPPSWPAPPHPGWARFREAWLHVLAEARRVARHGLDNVDSWSPCEAPVSDWGGWIDRARAARLGLRRVACGDTRNDFYTRR